MSDAVSDEEQQQQIFKFTDILAYLKEFTETHYKLDVEFMSLAATYLGSEGEAEDGTPLLLEDLIKLVDADLVRHVVLREVNKCMGKRVDIAANKEEVKEGLTKLLCVPLPDRKTKRLITEYLNINKLRDDNGDCRLLKSPLDFLKYGILKVDALQTFVMKLIECQLQIKWATADGSPEGFSYYEFCDVERSMKAKKKWERVNWFKNNIRNAQAKVQLYRFCRQHPALEITAVTEICPSVFVHTAANDWKRLNKELDRFEETEDHFAWIDEPIREYILENAKIIPEEKASLTKHTLYWAVVEDSNFEAAGDNFKLNPIGKTQVYVGKASNGIKDRWVSNSSSHCRKMKKCFHAMRGMATYDAQLLADVQLVEAVLLLEKLKGNKNSALFVMETFGDDVAGAKKAFKDAEKSLNDEENVLEDEKPALEENRNALQEKINDLRDVATNALTTAELNLKETESRNISGKRTACMNAKHLNVIPSKTISPRWEPINMAYGMNMKREKNP